MIEETKPMEVLVDLQRGINSGITLRQCELDPRVYMTAGRVNGRTRYCYVLVEQGIVKALSLFVQDDPIGNIDRFLLGYAVAEKYRRRGYGTKITGEGIAELAGYLAKRGVAAFYVTAFVAMDNIASRKVAEKVLTKACKKITEDDPERNACYYVRLVQCI